jgi:hypothetical protein
MGNQAFKGRKDDHIEIKLINAFSSLLLEDARIVPTRRYDKLQSKLTRGLGATAAGSVDP